MMDYLPYIIGLVIIAALVYAVYSALTYPVAPSDITRTATENKQENATEASGALRDYLTYRFENTQAGLREKDEYTQALAANGYRITSEHIEQGHIKGNEQCCWALVCLPGIFLAGRTPGMITVTYRRLGKDEGVRQIRDESTKLCPFCAETIQKAATKCRYCGEFLDGSTKTT